MVIIMALPKGLSKAGHQLLDESCMKSLFYPQQPSKPTMMLSDGGVNVDLGGEEEELKDDVMKAFNWKPGKKVAVAKVDEKNGENRERVSEAAR